MTYNLTHIHRKDGRYLEVDVLLEPNREGRSLFNIGDAQFVALHDHDELAISRDGVSVHRVTRHFREI